MDKEKLRKLIINTWKEGNSKFHDQKGSIDYDADLEEWLDIIENDINELCDGENLSPQETNMIKVSLVKEKSNFKKQVANNPESSQKIMRKLYGNDINVYESFYIVLLDVKNNTIGYAKISQGGLYESTVDLRLVAKYALDTLANSVIICHNHPSGNPNPSIADNELTNKIKDGLQTLKIALLDHIIITDKSYYSYVEHGKL